MSRTLYFGLARLFPFCFANVQCHVIKNLLTSTVRAVRENIKPRSSCIDLAIAELTIGGAAQVEQYSSDPECGDLRIMPEIETSEFAEPLGCTATPPVPRLAD